jgi:hypothetical protein
LVVSTNAPRNGIYISGDLNGESLANCFRNSLQGNSNVLRYPTPITYTCGTKLILSDIFIAFDAGQDNFCDKNPSGSNCDVIIPSKCRRQDPIVVEAPLVADFSAAGSCPTAGQAFQTYTFTVNIAGGTEPYSFFFTFGDGTTSPTFSSANTTQVTHLYTSGGQKSVTLTVTDAKNRRDTQTETITVAPCCQFLVTCPSVANSNLGTFNCKNLADIPAPPTTEATAEASPYDIVIGNNPCGTIRVSSSDNATPNACSESNQTITRTVAIYDDLDNDNVKDVNEPSQSCTFTYTIVADQTDPTFTAPANVTVSCASQIPAANPGAITDEDDNCAGTVTITHEGDAITNQTCANGYTLTRTYRATDACGNTTDHTQTITVADTENPVFTFVPLGADLGCNPTSIPVGNATATDNCGAPTITSTLGAVTMNGCSRSQTRTYTATDACDNTATANQVFTWTSDTEEPDITIISTSLNSCNPSSAQIDAALGTATATDNCGLVTVNTTTDDVTSNGCIRTQMRTFTSTDACNNTATASRTVTWTVPTVINCYSVFLTNVVYSGGNTKFTYKVCANDCPNALSYIAFIINSGISVVSPPKGSTYNYPGAPDISYKVVIPVRNGVNGVKFETIGAGIKNACDVFEFTLSGDQRNTTIKIETKAGTKVSTGTISAQCVCPLQNPTARIATAEVPNAAQNITMNAFPNPAHGEATIQFTVAKTEQTSLVIYSTLGTSVKTLFNGVAEGGKTYRVTFKADSNVKAGTYIYRLHSGTESKANRLIMLKR